jgi:hypothetical protein
MLSSLFPPSSVQGLVSLLTALTALVAALTGLFVVIVQITNLRNHINSRMDQLLALQATASHAEGMKDEHTRAKIIADAVLIATVKDKNEHPTEAP